MAEPRELSHIEPVKGTDIVRLVFKDGGEPIECRIAHGSLLYELAVWTLKKLEPSLQDGALEAARKK